eukprot:1177108-Prorocentrum_minimum.AAC.1
MLERAICIRLLEDTQNKSINLTLSMLAIVPGILPGGRSRYTGPRRGAAALGSLSLNSAPPSPVAPPAAREKGLYRVVSTQGCIYTGLYLHRALSTQGSIYT